ncbi:MAG: formyltetrahydrofolate deformylase [Nitrosopumilus sp. B06]|nr:MAG: formyltetrahydrofolate deformylase [Nitrosopumilus sp. B06]
MKKTTVGVTIVGRDHGGIVAAFTNFAFSSGGNIEKVNQNVIKGLFGMYLEISFAKKTNAAKFDSQIQLLARKQKMDVSTHHGTSLRKNIAVFVTKEPHCLEMILKNSRTLGGRIALIVGTEKSLAMMAKKAKIPFVLVSGRSQQKAEEKIITACKKYNIDLIALARYMRILSPNFVWRYPERIINIHPSILPAFPGAMAYAQAHERGTKIIGVTSHYVTENLDQGPIILQDSFKVDPDDTLEQIKKRGQKLEATTLLKAVRMHLAGKLDVRWRKVHLRK